MSIKDIFARIVGDNRSSFSSTTDRLALVGELTEQFMALDPAKYPRLKTMESDWKADEKRDMIPVLKFTFDVPPEV